MHCPRCDAMLREVDLFTRTALECIECDFIEFLIGEKAA